MPKTCSVSSLFRLLDLPVELRSEIYRHVLFNPHTLLHRSNAPPISKLHCSFIPSLFLVSDDLCNATRPIFYAINTFSFSINPGSPNSISFPETEDPFTQLPWIAHLSIKFVPDFWRVDWQASCLGAVIAGTIQRIRCRAFNASYPSVEAATLKSLTLRIPYAKPTPLFTQRITEALALLVAREAGMKLELQLFDPNHRFRLDAKDVENLLTAVGRGQRWKRWTGPISDRRELIAVLGGDGKRKLRDHENRMQYYKIPRTLRMAKEERQVSEVVDQQGRMEYDVGFLWEK